MAKIFEYKAGSFIDQVSKTVMTPTDVTHRQTEKGIAGVLGEISHIDLSNAPTAFGTNSFSLVFNCKPKDFKNALNVLIRSATNGLDAFFNSTGNFVISKNGVANIFVSSMVFSKNVYYQIKYIRTSGLSYFYVNNILISSQADTTDYSVKFTQIGRNTNGFIGDILGIKIYDHSLSSQERNELYQEFLNSSPTEKDIRGIEYPKHTALSSEVDSVVGDNILTNGDFSSTTGWTPARSTFDITTNPGKATVVSNDSNAYITKSITTVVGRKYKVQAKVFGTLSTGSGNIELRAGITLGATTNLHKSYSFPKTDLVVVGEFTATSTTTYISLVVANNGVTVVWGDVIVNQLSGLVAAYSFSPETVSNGTLLDVSGNSNHGTINGALLTKEGMKFDGVDDYISLPSVPVGLQNTIAFKFKYSTITSVSYFFGTNTSSGYDFRYDGSIFLIRINSSTSVSGNISLIDGVEYDIVLARNNTSVEMYINGTLFYTFSDVNFTTEATLIFLGRRRSGLYTKFETQDFKIYNYAFTPQQAKDYSNSFIHPTLILDFSDEAVGNTI